MKFFGMAFKGRYSACRTSALALKMVAKLSRRLHVEPSLSVGSTLNSLGRRSKSKDDFAAETTVNSNQDGYGLKDVITDSRDSFMHSDFPSDLVETGHLSDLPDLHRSGRRLKVLVFVFKVF